jgi:hypothetical protein
MIRLIKSHWHRVLCWLAISGALFLIVGLLAVYLPSPARADIGIYESCLTCVDDGNTTVYSDNWAAQTFTPTQDHSTQYISLKLLRIGNCTDVTAKVAITSTSSGKPSGPDKAYGYIDVSKITDSGNGTWYNVSLNKIFYAEYNVQYAITLNLIEGGDASNHLIWRYDDDAAYTGGNRTTSINGGDDWTLQDDDFMFRTWGESGLTIHSAEVYTGYKETGDALIVVEYTNEAAPHYPIPGRIERYFRIQLLEGNCTGIVLAETVPMMWGHRVGSIYLSADEAERIEWMPPDERYYIQIIANYGSYCSSCYNLGNGTWIGMNLNLLDSWCKKVAAAIGTEEERSYLTTIAGKGQVLSDDTQSNGESGMSIFTVGIPELATRRPDLVQVSQSTTELPSGTPTGALQSSSSMTTALGATITNTFNAIATFFGINGGVLALFTAIMMWLYISTQTVGVGAGVAGAILAIPFMIGAAYIGVLAWIYIALLAILSIFAFGWHYIARQT